MYCCFVDFSDLYGFEPEMKKKMNYVCEKMRKIKANNDLDAQKRAELNFCTRQYLYNSE